MRECVGWTVPSTALGEKHIWLTLSSQGQNGEKIMYKQGGNEWMDVLQRVPAENRSRLGLGSVLGIDESGMGSKKPKNKTTFIKTNISK